MSNQSRRGKKPTSRKGIAHHNPRQRLSCEPCRDSKLRCDRGHPCAACKRRGCEASCNFRGSKISPVKDSGRNGIDASSTSHQVLRTSTRQSLGSHSEIALRSPLPDTASPALPIGGGDLSLPLAESLETPSHNTQVRLRQSSSSGQGWQPETPLAPTTSLDAALERPAFGQDRSARSSNDTWLQSFAFGPDVPLRELLAKLPSTTTRTYLISRYMIYQAPLFDVLHGPTFQKQYTDFDQGNREPSLQWLAVLFAICFMGVLTLDDEDPVLHNISSSTPGSNGHTTLHLSQDFRAAALACLSESRFMVSYDLDTLEALLILIYGTCHSDGVDRAWVFLGVALNIGIALRCNTDNPSLDDFSRERGQRCWDGIRALHTYQGLLFRDINMSFLIDPSLTAQGDANALKRVLDHPPDIVVHSSRSLVMKFKLRLFVLSNLICPHPAKSSPPDLVVAEYYDSLIAQEQQHWDKAYLVNGSPDILNASSNAYWCILQTYAHELYLLNHRPFYHSRSPNYQPSSRERYLHSSVALLHYHQQICELPTLRPYRWLVNGMASFDALQGAAALADCIMDKPEEVNSLVSQREAFDACVDRIKSQQSTSPLCARAYPALRDLQTQLTALFEAAATGEFQDWDSISNWLDLSSIDWSYWDGIVSSLNE